MEHIKNSNNIISSLFTSLITKGWIYIILCVLLYFFYRSVLSQNTFSTLSIIMLPFAALIIAFMFVYTDKILYSLFISQLIFIIAGGYIDFQVGVTNLTFSFFALLTLLIHNIYQKTDWKQSKNAMLILFIFWSAFCVLEIANPNHIQEAWNISITHYAFYPILCSILVPLSIRQYKHIELLLIIWAIFLLIVSFKGYWQKTHGFNQRELYALYELGKASTHLIWSGIRYFSFFSDAANFGVHMAMGATAFSIALFFTKKIWLKILFFLVVIASIYGLGISGTRAGMAVPLGGLALYILLSKSKIGFLIGTFTLLSMFFFFRFTIIGEGNEYIRKMRSAFYATEDASYQVRVANREKMKVLMASKPFGYGIGLGGKAERFKPKELMPYPPDSWLVNVWTDTGIVGLVLYLAVHISLFLWCSWILWFKIKHKPLKGLLTAWLCTNAGFFVAAYANDVMQYPNSIIVYTGFALCFAGVHIDKKLTEEEEENKKNIPIL